MAKAPLEIRSLARVHTRSALNTLAKVMAKSTSDAAKVAAAEALLSRGWGKAPVSVGIGQDENLGPIQIAWEDEG
jgi:hypothetical protein